MDGVAFARDPIELHLQVRDWLITSRYSTCLPELDPQNTGHDRTDNREDENHHHKSRHVLTPVTRVGTAKRPPTRDGWQE